MNEDFPDWIAFPGFVTSPFRAAAPTFQAVFFLHSAHLHFRVAVLQDLIVVACEPTVHHAIGEWSVRCFAATYRGWQHFFQIQTDCAAGFDWNDAVRRPVPFSHQTPFCSRPIVCAPDQWPFEGQQVPLLHRPVVVQKIQCSLPVPLIVHLPSTKTHSTLFHVRRGIEDVVAQGSYRFRGCGWY